MAWWSDAVIGLPRYPDGLSCGRSSSINCEGDLQTAAAYWITNNRAAGGHLGWNPGSRKLWLYTPVADVENPDYLVHASALRCALNSAINSCMAIDSAKNSRGRPRVDSEAVNVRMSRALLEQLDTWIAKQEMPFTPPEAIRAILGATDRSGPRQGLRRLRFPGRQADGGRSGRNVSWLNAFAEGEARADAAYRPFLRVSPSAVRKRPGCLDACTVPRQQVLDPQATQLRARSNQRPHRSWRTDARPPITAKIGEGPAIF